MEVALYAVGIESSCARSRCLILTAPRPLIFKIKYDRRQVIDNPMATVQQRTKIKTLLNEFELAEMYYSVVHQA